MRCMCKHTERVHTRPRTACEVPACGCRVFRAEGEPITSNTSPFSMAPNPLIKAVRVVEPEPMWRVVVEIPMRVEGKGSLFGAISDAAFEWEPEQRDGWDVDVYGEPSCDCGGAA